MTNDIRSDMPDAFERALAARLDAYAAVASGPPSSEAVARAVATGPRAAQAGALRRGAWPRSRLLVLAGVALVSASFLAGLIAGRFLERDEHRPSPAIPANVIAALRVFATSAPGPVELWNSATQQFERVSGGWSGSISPDGLHYADLNTCSRCDLLVADLIPGAPIKSGRRALDRVELSSGGVGLGVLGWSPDSRFLARAANGRLDIVDVLGDPTPRNPNDMLPRRTIDVAGAGSASQLAWSADGRTIALISESGDLQTVDVASGALRELTAGGTFERARQSIDPLPLFWSWDGGSIVSWDGTQPVVVALESGSARRLGWLVAADQILGWSADGRVMISGLSQADRNVVGVGGGDGGCESPVAIATDGRAAHVLSGSLFVGTLGEFGAPIATNLCGVGDSANIAWSPSGEWLAIELFLERASEPGSYRFETRLIPSAGGQPVVYARDDREGLGHQVRWSPPGG